MIRVVARHAAWTSGPSRGGFQGATGFSLVEVLVALVILAVGATSLIALFASAGGTHRRAVDRTRAPLVAEQLLSEIRSRYVPGADLKDILRDLKDKVPERIDGYHWGVTLWRPGQKASTARATPGTSKPGDDGSPWGEDELIVRVAIRWSRAASAREEVYTTIILPRWLGGRGG